MQEPPTPTVDIGGAAQSVMNWLGGMFAPSEQNPPLPPADTPEPIWPTRNVVGTETLQDTRGSDQPARGWQPMDQPDEIRQALAPAPDTQYGEVLPFARDTTTDELRPALPSGVRSLINGLYDLAQGTKTGEVTPEATAALAALAAGKLGTAPIDDILLQSFGGSHRALRDATIAARTQATTNLGRVIEGTEQAAVDAKTAPARALQAAVEEDAAASQARAGLINGTPMVANLAEDAAGAARDLDAEGGRRVSTRIPYNVVKPPEVPPSVVAHANETTNIGIDAARQAADSFEKNATHMKDSGLYPDLPLKGMRNTDAMMDKAIDHMRDNIIWLHDQMRDSYGQSTVDRASLWYDGANRIARQLALETGMTLQQVAAVMANLSPQKDWFQNVDLAKRLIDIKMNHANDVMTPEMDAWITKYITTKRADLEKKIAKAQNAGALTPKKQAIFDTQSNDLHEHELSQTALRRGIPLSEINDPDTEALFYRAYDEAHNSRQFPTLTPEGDVGPTALAPNGRAPEKISWGSFIEIKKAIDMLRENPSMEAISRSLGGQHKVRSFHNNIFDPNALFDDSTIDTHAIAGGHLCPLGASSNVVAAGLGGHPGSSHAATGSKGMYGLYHEAYRRAAEILTARGTPLLPRQVQSIAWEAVRGLFTDVQKRTPSFVAANDNIWQGFRDGKYDAATARQMVLNLARPNGHIIPPVWYSRPIGSPETPENPIEDTANDDTP
jgi:hypothetical protein